jgi:carboxypeptidase Q
VMAALGNSVGTPPEGLEAEIAWYPDLAALRADTTDKAKGRIVFLDQKTDRTKDGSGYGRAVGARFSGAVEAAKRGALALAIRSIGTDRDRVAHTGAMGYDIAVPRIPAFAVSVPDAELITRLVARGGTPKLAVNFETKSDVDATTHNVIAEVPGTDLAGEIVLIGAHLDSWDLGQGAVDDGAGIAIVSAAAALIQRAGRKPRRTIRVVLFGNEENGFDGARGYGDRHGSAVHQLVAESDFGAGRIWRFASRVQADALPLADAIGAQLAPLGIERGNNAAGPGPDAAVLMRRHKWPAVQLHQDGTNYFDVHHTENDVLEKVDPAPLPQNVAAWAVTAWLAAQSPLPFGPPPL